MKQSSIKREDAFIPLAEDDDLAASDEEMMEWKNEVLGI